MQHGDKPSHSTGPETPGVSQRLNALISRSRLALFLERLVRAAFYPFVVVVLFLAVTLLGGWVVAPLWLHVLGLAGFALAFLWSLCGFYALRWPSREEAQHRIEAASPGLHRPLTAFEDDLAISGESAETRTLWLLHKRRMASLLAGLKSPLPDPRSYRQDPFALRVAVVMLVVLGLVSSTGMRMDRLASTLRFGADPQEIASRLDAWVTPPIYTNLPPIYLTGESAALRDPAQALTVPEGARFVVRSQGTEGFRIEADDGIRLEDVDETAAPDAVLERQAVLEQTGRIDLYYNDSLLMGWHFEVLPDETPVIRLSGEPEAQLSGALKLAYTVQDDYRVLSAEARIAAPAAPMSGTGGLALPQGDPRPLAEAPQFPLSLPSAAGTDGAAETIRDLTSHPWAGSEVQLTLHAMDEAGQEGVSPTYELTLPQRRFRKPLAKAVVEQRRLLAMDARSQDRAIMAFDALLLAPDSFNMVPKNYLGLRFAYTRLYRAKSDEELKELLPLLWDLALTIEDGDLSLAERALRQAQENLRKALEDGASDEEIARLTEELRQALDEYMQALAEQMQRNPQAMQPFSPQQQQSLSQQDLSEMLDRIEELAQTGSRDAARELLAEMQRMLENLQAGRPQMMPQNNMSGEMMEMLNELGEMIRKQQELMDQTHQFNQQQQQQGQRQPGQQGQQQPGGQMTQEQLAEMLKQLQEGQGGLEQQLQQLMEQLAQNGMGESGELGEAGKSMGEAQQSLGQGEGQSAVGQQGSALDALRRGAQGMAEQMMGQGEGPGMAQGRSPLDEDPLGRPRRSQGPDFGNQVKVPDEIDVQRARRILDELRKRFADPSRPKLELDYLERLLKRY
ncbi:TIGR02302 family protein [Roseibium sp. CAU 1637]|uniref:TIGR02302 family protein n=1 Tax=Roseibium limicola TaxID=2816037 RepID=A0A939ER26_9HYPH|nr:TIGR02302 family protein [Roseibium limicola]MBO0347099.1 TIGR02302 family protein [Roseibium limicola]